MAYRRKGSSHLMESEMKARSGANVEVGLQFVKFRPFFFNVLILKLLFPRVSALKNLDLCLSNLDA